MFAYSVVFFSSSAYLFYHRWKYLSTHFLQRASVFRTIPVASFVFLCRKYFFAQSKKNSLEKNERSNLERLLRSISIFGNTFRDISQAFFKIAFLCLLRIKFCVVKSTPLTKIERSNILRIFQLFYNT